MPPHAYIDAINEDHCIPTMMQELVALNVNHEWVVFGMDLLYLDEIKISKKAFMELCIDLYTLDRDFKILVATAVKKWNANMTHEEVKQAAVDCNKVFDNIARVTMRLGDEGAKILLGIIFGNSKFPLPKTIEMVWNYVDWKLATSVTCQSRRGKVLSPWDDVFTPENASMDNDVRCAVNIGMQLMKLEK
jgi:hypothetical protein